MHGICYIGDCRDLSSTYQVVLVESEGCHDGGSAPYRLSKKLSPPGVKLQKGPSMTSYSAVAKVSFLWAVPLYSSNPTFLADQLCRDEFIPSTASSKSGRFCFPCNLATKFFPFPLTNINTKAQHSQLLGIDQHDPCTRYLLQRTSLLQIQCLAPIFSCSPPRLDIHTVTLGGARSIGRRWPRCLTPVTGESK